MVTKTSQHEFEVPDEGARDWDDEIRNNWERADRLIPDAGTLSNRPSAGVVDRVYLATDTQEVYYDDGTSWTLLGIAEGQIDLANLASRSHSDLSDAPASAHHAEPSAGTGITDEGTNQFGLTNDSLTINVGEGIEGGGTVSLGGSTTINAKEPVTFDPGMTNWGTGTDQEIWRRQLQSGETFVVERIEFRQKGGGSSTSADIDVYDSTAAATVGSQTLGGTTKDPGSSGSANLVTIRLTNSTGSAIDAAPTVTGYIEGA